MLALNFDLNSGLKFTVSHVIIYLSLRHEIISVVYLINFMVELIVKILIHV